MNNVLTPGKLYRIKKFVNGEDTLDNKLVGLPTNTTLLCLTTKNSKDYGFLFTDCFFLYGEKTIKISLTESNSVLSINKVLEEV